MQLSALLLLLLLGYLQDEFTYPYGGKRRPDSSFPYEKRVINPFNVTSDTVYGALPGKGIAALWFEDKVDLSAGIFRKPAYFRKAVFRKEVRFDGTEFFDRTYFREADFHSFASFSDAVFHSEECTFRMAHFRAGVGFDRVRFLRLVDFAAVQFDTACFFWKAHFGGVAGFKQAIFTTECTDFIDASFHDYALFSLASFGDCTRFTGCQFLGVVDFRDARFKGKVRFNEASFYRKADFRYAYFGTLGIADFSFATVRDTIFVGDSPLQLGRIQHFDFSLTKFLSEGKEKMLTDTLCVRQSHEVSFPGAKIVLCGIVDIRLPWERFELLEIENSLDYFSKANIVSYLKESSYKGDQYSRERFELDYLFAKSTMNQLQSGEDPSILRRLWNGFYEMSLDLGYRPFKIFYLVVPLILCSLGSFSRSFVSRSEPFCAKVSQSGQHKKGNRNTLWLGGVLMTS